MEVDDGYQVRSKMSAQDYRDEISSGCVQCLGELVNMYELGNQKAGKKLWWNKLVLGRGRQGDARTGG